MRFFAQKNIGSPVNCWATNQLRDTQLGDMFQSTGNSANFFYLFSVCVLFWLICAEALCLLCCDRRRWMR